MSTTTPSVADVIEPPDHEVVVIGAGIGGLGMGYRLREAGITDFVIFERANDIGGTWRDNTYPGVAVDVPAQAYQFRHQLNPEWTRVFAKGAEVKAYIDRYADEHDLRRHIELGASVRRRTWDERSHRWRLTVNDREVTARFVVSAIGAFVEPKPIDIPGVDDFTGTVLRSASWDHTVDLRDQRVAVVGTGASAVQIVPEIARHVAHLDVYQRTPIWVGPKLDPTTPEGLRRVYRRVPAVQEVVRRVATRGTELLLIDLVVHHRRVPFVTRTMAALARRVWYRSQVRDAETRRKLTPDYGIGCKRPSVSSTYLKTFNRRHVDLVTDPIERITPTGIRTNDGHDRPVDVLVLATGFRMATDPAAYTTSPVTGRDGFDLASHYASERLSSYEGVSMPGLPNHFMIFGPYGWTGGTWHELVDTASTHIVRVISEAHARRATAVEVTPAATRRWTADMRRRLGPSLFNTNGCVTANSYYFDHHGDTPFLRPTSAAQARRACRTFPLDDYAFESPLSRGADHDHRDHARRDQDDETRRPNEATGPTGADSADRVPLPG